MTHYELAWDDTRTGRVRAADSQSLEPLAWLRVTWGEDHEIVRVDVYRDGARPADRAWLTGSASIREAVEICHDYTAELRTNQSVEAMPAELGEPWEHHSVVDVE